MARKSNILAKPRLGQLILKSLDDKNETQKWLALKIGKSPQHVCNIISGKDAPSLSMILDIARCLEIEPSVLLAFIIEARCRN